MKLTKEDKTWIKRNKKIIDKLLNGRYEDLKEQLVSETDPEKLKKVQFWANEIKLGKQILEAITKEKDKNTFTGI